MITYCTVYSDASINAGVVTNVALFAHLENTMALFSPPPLRLSTRHTP